MKLRKIVFFLKLIFVCSFDIKIRSAGFEITVLKTCEVIHPSHFLFHTHLPPAVDLGMPHRAVQLPSPLLCLVLIFLCLLVVLCVLTNIILEMLLCPASSKIFRTRRLMGFVASFQPWSPHLISMWYCGTESQCWKEKVIGSFMLFNFPAFRRILFKSNIYTH